VGIVITKSAVPSSILDTDRYLAACMMTFDETFWGAPERLPWKRL